MMTWIAAKMLAHWNRTGAPKPNKGRPGRADPRRAPLASAASRFRPDRRPHRGRVRSGLLDKIPGRIPPARFPWSSGRLIARRRAGRARRRSGHKGCRFLATATGGETFLRTAGFYLHVSRTYRLAPRRLGSRVALDCCGRRVGPVRAARPRLDRGAGHRGAVEETGRPEERPLWRWTRLGGHSL